MSRELRTEETLRKSAPPVLRAPNLCMSPLNNSLAARIPSVSLTLLTGLRMHLAHAHACQIPTLHRSRFVFSPKPQPPGIARPEAVHGSPHIGDGTRLYVNFSVYARSVCIYIRTWMPALSRRGTSSGSATDRNTLGEMYGARDAGVELGRRGTCVVFTKGREAQRERRGAARWAG